MFVVVVRMQKGGDGVDGVDYIWASDVVSSPPSQSPGQETRNRSDTPLIIHLI
jgi:hypothetical protein